MSAPPGPAQPRGRARGRARGQPGAAAPKPGPGGPQQPPSRPAVPGQQWPQQQQRPPQQQQPPQRPPQQQQPPRGQPQPQAQGGRALHRPSTRSDVPPGDVGALARGVQHLEVTEGGNGAASVGRGALRGRRVVQPDIVRTRPDHVTSKRGTTGRAIKLIANYFPLLTHTNWCLYQYRVDFSPEEDIVGVRKALLRVHKETLGGYIFDGSMMFTSHRLTHDPMELFSTRNSDQAQVRITIKLVGEVSPTDHHYIQFFNILMRKCLDHLKLQLVGRNFFDAAAKVSVDQYRLELWPGYVTSIRQHESQIMMCSEITYKVMRQDSVLSLLKECLQRRDADFKRAFTMAIVGSVVLTDYNNRTYRVDDVDYSVTPSSTFKMRDNTDVSYITYYQQRYNLRITDGNQPLLVSRAKARDVRAGMADKIYLVPELCRLTGLTDEMRANFSLMRALADHTRVGPSQRLEKLKQFSRRLLSQKDVVTDLKEWNMQLSEQLVEFDARVLPIEKIVLGNTSVEAGQQADWTRDLRSNAMLHVAKLENWAVVCPNRMKRDAQGFVSSLMKAAGGMRFGIQQPVFLDIQDDRAGTIVDALEQVIAGKNPQLVMVVVSNNRADRYAAIKKKCAIDRAVASQVILAKNLASKGVMSIATKVAIQINCKLGGAPWTIENPLSGLMVVGFDVCHDTNSRERSFGALVASLDKPVSRYFSAVSPHTDSKDVSSQMAVNMVKALHKYREANQGALPQRIIVYRDGVGEGDLNTVYEYEVANVIEKLKELYGGNKPKMAYIIVNKRINTRLFFRADNPPPGTVADDCITMPERYDFFLVSQSVRQGTVSPTAYNVIYDTVGLDPDKIQRFTYKMTHLYYNWSGTVRVPAPCQYAHKLAFLVGQSLHQAPAQQLDNVLHFL